ncbi:unnamed protein product [Meganyctiphanes norvegica]|uniref:Uncharacterized protein n=1 Tax=Meganyctiphanes norvegica TaxID=48144 RepID=A0AAV2QMZ1_MEGNR
MFSLKLSLVVCCLATGWLEAKPAPAMPVGTYSYSSQLGSNSIDQQQPVETTRTIARGRFVAGGSTDIASYQQVEDTPEVQEANAKFFDAFKQQTDLINEVREEGLWSAQPYADHYEDFEEAGLSENEYEEDEEEGEGGEEEDEEEEDDEDDEDEEDSDESDSSSSSEEDSDEEDEDEEKDEEEGDEEEDEEDEEGDEDEEDSSSSSEEDSSSSSSSSSEENGDPALLSMQALQALQPKQVEDTPEVEAAKLKFFDQYKAQLELVTNDI